MVMDMGLKDIFNSAKEKINQKKEASNQFNVLISMSTHLDGMIPYEAKNQSPSLGREQKILSLCLPLSVEKSKLVNSLIPIEETVIAVRTVVESKTLYDYIFVITNQRFWVINKQEYKTYQFEEIHKFYVVDNSILSQKVNFNDSAFVIEGSDKEVSRFISTATNASERNLEIASKTRYLCGIVPKFQLLNLNMAGLSIDENNRIVLHNGEEYNLLIDINDIQYMQLLLDNTVVLTRGKMTQSQTSMEVPCKNMSVKIVLKDSEFIIKVMKDNLMGTTIKQEDSKYISNIEFAKKIISTLENLMNEK